MCVSLSQSSEVLQYRDKERLPWTALDCLTALDVLIGISNYETTNDITSMNFVILFDENCIYTCSKNGMQRDCYNLQVQLKAHMITEEVRYSMCNKSL